MSASLFSDSEAAEGAAGRAWADPEGTAGEQQATATGVRPPGGARERKSPTDGGGTSTVTAAGRDWGLICLTDSDCKVKWLLLFFSLCSCCADCRWWVSVQTAGERVPAVQRTTEHQTRVQTAVRDQPAHPREGKAAALGIVLPGKTVLIIMKLKSKLQQKSKEIKNWQTLFVHHLSVQVSRFSSQIYDKLMGQSRCNI